MNRKKKIIISIIGIIMLIVVVGAATYAYIIAITNKENVASSSGLLDINYTEPGDITGTLIPSSDRSGGLFTSAKASLINSSVDAILNMYITPTALTNLNIPALKWEAEGIRNGTVICSGSGDFSSATVGTPIKLFENDVTDNINDCKLSTTETTFNIYIWLDVSLINTSLGGISFGATIGADSVDITGMFEGDTTFNRLPNGYQAVEYIESTGTQYINTGYIPKTGDVYKVKFLQTNIEGNQIIFGSRTSGTYKDSLNQVYLNKTNAIANPDALLFFSGTTSKNFSLTQINKIYDLQLSVNSGNFDNTSNQPLYLFCFNNMGNITAYANTKLFEFTISNNNTLIRDMIPCYRKSDNVIGMYDVVENVFYTNLGTGNFEKGNDV